MHSDGLEAATLATVNDRYWRILSGVLEIKSILQDCRINSVGGAMAGIQMFELAIIPIMLTNTSTWTGANIQAIKKLTDLQNKFYCFLFETPRTSPTVALTWDAGAMDISFRIKQEKLTFLYHLATLSPESLANQIFEAQKSYEFPGMVKECESLIKELDLPNIIKDLSGISKVQWKNRVKSALRTKFEDESKEKMKGLKKVKEGPMIHENFETRQYLKELTLDEARTKFKIRCEMTDLKFNFKHDKKYSDELWKCDSCQTSIESQQHVLICPAYSELREGKDINNDKDLTSYIKQVMKIREKLKITK